MGSSLGRLGRSPDDRRAAEPRDDRAIVEVRMLGATA